MELHRVHAIAAPAERSAVDALLGPPNTDDELERSEHGRPEQIRQQRHLLLPALHTVQDAIGWISEGALGYICERLQVPPAEAYGVIGSYALLSTQERASRVAHICDDIVCRSAGATTLAEELAQAIDGEEAFECEPSPCLGLCERAPAAFLQRAGGKDSVIAPASAATVMASLYDEPLDQEYAPTYVSAPQTIEPRAAGLRLLRRVGLVDPTSLDDYRTNSGYTALSLALHHGSEWVLRELAESRLLGRGGAAFPTGRKWQDVAHSAVFPHYVVCNADESEPGTFKDRVLMEEDPFALIEALTVAGVVTGAERGYLYVRREYPVATMHLADAISQATASGLLGDDVMGSGKRFEIEIRRGAGAYICGEETALFNSIEGFRGEPRSKPPYPTQSGLFGKPTLVNNVETLVNVLDILLDGGEVFASSGSKDSAGSKLFCVAGRVRQPGVYEVPFGATIRDLLMLAGGVLGGGEPAAILVGGAAGSFVTTEQLELPLTFEDTRRVGITLGSGALTVFDEAVDLGDVVRRIAAFFRDESCGQCVPCRIGTVRQEEALHRLAKANGNTAEEFVILDDITRAMTDASICGLGQTAGSAVRSAITLGLLNSGRSTT